MKKQIKFSDNNDVTVTWNESHPLLKQIQTHFEENTKFFVTEIDLNTIKISGKWFDFDLVISINWFTENDPKEAIAFCEASVKDYLADVWIYEINEPDEEVITSLAQNMFDHN